MKTSHIFIALGMVLTSFPLLVTSPAYAKDHSKEYQVGIVVSAEQLNDGSITRCQGSLCATSDSSNNIHFVRVPNGIYAINAPVDVSTSILNALGTMGTGGEDEVAHKEWFMDHLQPGDKVLFAAKCDKHNNCSFWLPNPNHPGKEIGTDGYFHPNVANSNTQTLCGTGELTPAVEAQVCPTNSQAKH